MPLRSNFSLGNVVDPTKGATTALNNIGNIMNQAQKIEGAKQAQANADRRFGLAQSQSAIQQAVEDRANAAYESKVASDLAITEALSGLQTTKTGKDIAAVEGVTGNADYIAEVQKRNSELSKLKEKLSTERDLAADAYNTSLIPTPKKEVPIKDEVITNKEVPIGIDANGRRMMSTLTTRVPSPFDVVGSFLGDASNNLLGTSFGKHAKGSGPDPVAPARGTGVVVKAAPVKPSNELQALTTLENSINNLSAAETVPALIKSVKAVEASKGKTTAIPVADQRAAMFKAIQENNNIAGPAKLTALKQVNALFPVAKETSASDRLAQAKWREQGVTDATTVKDYKAANPGFAGNTIKSVEIHAKAAADKAAAKAKKAAKKGTSWIAAAEEAGLGDDDYGTLQKLSDKAKKYGISPTEFAEMIPAVNREWGVVFDGTWTDKGLLHEIEKSLDSRWEAKQKSIKK